LQEPLGHSGAGVPYESRIELVCIHQTASHHVTRAEMWEMANLLCADGVRVLVWFFVASSATAMMDDTVSAVTGIASLLRGTQIQFAVSTLDASGAASLLRTVATLVSSFAPQFLSYCRPRENLKLCITTEDADACVMHVADVAQSVAVFLGQARDALMLPGVANVFQDHVFAVVSRSAVTSAWFECADSCFGTQTVPVALGAPAGAVTLAALATSAPEIAGATAQGLRYCLASGLPKGAERTAFLALAPLWMQARWLASRHVTDVTCVLPHVSAALVELTAAANALFPQTQRQNVAALGRVVSAALSLLGLPGALPAGNRVCALLSDLLADVDALVECKTDAELDELGEQIVSLCANGPPSLSSAASWNPRRRVWEAAAQPEKVFGYATTGGACPPVARSVSTPASYGTGTTRHPLRH
jgi:hypothetical protein